MNSEDRKEGWLTRLFDWLDDILSGHVSGEAKARRRRAEELKKTEKKNVR